MSATASSRTLVVDASVAGKWFFPEEHADRALRLLSSRRVLLAPDLIVAEFGNLLWKRCRRGDITADQSEALLADFLRFPIQILPSSPLAPTALDLALRTGRTVYDCLYLALAVNRDCRLSTGDERFVNALAEGPLARHIQWIGAKR